jgi:hypothetical protein
MLEPSAVETAKLTFARCPKYCDFFVKTAFLTAELLETGLLKPFMGAPTRLQSATTNQFLTLEQVLWGLNK